MSVVHVVVAPRLARYSRRDPERRRFHRRARRRLDALVAEVPDAEPVLMWGPPADRVLEWAREARPDVLVAASHAGRIEGTLGSFSRRIATSAPCPALILPPGVEPGAEPAPGASPYPHIACCIDDSPASMRTLAEARRLRALGPGMLSLVHVTPRALIDVPAPSGAGPRDLADEEREWLLATAESVPGAEPVALTGLAPHAAIAWAREARPDLMVAGAHRRGMERALLGSFAAHLAREAPCPALLTR